ARLLRGGDHFLPSDVFAGVEVEYDPIAELQAAQPRTADMNFQRPELRQLNKIAEFFYRDHVTLLRFHDMAEGRVFDVRSDVLLKEAFAAAAIGPTHDVHR